MNQYAPAQLEQCVDSLYSVLGDTARFSVALESIGKLFGATGVSFLRTNSIGELIAVEDYGRDPALITRFIEYYAAIDPTRTPLVSALPGVWLQNDRLLDPRHTSEPEYVNDFAGDAGLRWFRGGKVEHQEFGAAFFSVHRPADAKPFDSRAIQALEELRPHLARIARLLAAKDAKDVFRDSASAVVDSLAVSVCIVNAAMRVTYVNSAGVSLLAAPGPLSVKANVLTARTSAAHGLLRHAVKLATTIPRQARAFCLNPEEPPQRRVQVRVSPLDERQQLNTAAAGPFAIVFMTRGSAPIQVIELRQLFGLTAAEAELVRLLCQGLSPATCASQRQVSMATIRTQLKSVYEKVGVSSLAQMVSLVISLPALRQPER